MTAAEAFAPAKVNLTLHITGQRDDGYHLLDSLVVFAAVGDRVTFTPAPAMSLCVTGPFASGVPTDSRNILWQAAQLAGVTGAVTVEKNLPHGAGIGGGSADAAALLRLLGQTDQSAALTLGADVPVCLSPLPQRMQGIGETLKPLPDTPEFHIVLVNPGVPVPTADVFAAFDRKSNPPMTPGPASPSLETWIEWLARQRNDLELPARAVAPVIDTVLTELSDADLARMSGSGATCFGIYMTAGDAARAASRIAVAHPDWWVRATTTMV